MIVSIREFKVSVRVLIPEDQLPEGENWTDDAIADIYNKAMARIESRGLMAVDISEIVDDEERGVF